MKTTIKKIFVSTALLATLTVSLAACHYHDRDWRDGYYDRYGRYQDRDDYRSGRRSDRDYWRSRDGSYRYDRDDWRYR